MVSKQVATEQVVGGALWGLGAALVGLAIGSWAQRRREDEVIERFLEALERDGWSLAREQQ